MTNLERDRAMYAKGYRYVVFIEGAPESLYFKSAMEIGPLLRSQYPDKHVMWTERLDQQYFRRMSGADEA